MIYLPHVWVYAGATCEDVYAQLDGKIDDNVNLECMSLPQLAFVAPAYSNDLVQKLAMDMWLEIQGDYEKSFERGISFHELTATMSAQVLETSCPGQCSNGYSGEMPVLEVTTWRYYLMHSIEPLMQVVVQKRPLWHPSLSDASGMFSVVPPET